MLTGLKGTAFWVVELVHSNFEWTNGVAMNLARIHVDRSLNLGLVKIAKITRYIVYQLLIM